MKNIKSISVTSIVIFLIFTFMCGVVYTGVATGLAQLLFPNKANGSIIKIEGKKYGSELLGQQFTDDAHMWGRIMNIDAGTYKDKDGKILMYAAPANLSPASKDFEELVAERVKKISESNPAMASEAIPVDLVTCSGSGLDPHISVAAAEYQVKRISKAQRIPESRVREIIDKCTEDKFLGLFGEKTVNVLKVNLMLDGILNS